MAVKNQKITDQYAIYCGDCIEVMDKLPKESIHFSMYSLPFFTDEKGLYSYSSDERDLSNCANKEQFMEQYEYVVRRIHDVTMPGRLSAVHCTTLPAGNSGGDYIVDFPGEIIRLHEKCGWKLKAEHYIWKEPLGVRNRTKAKDLNHCTTVDDCAEAGVASADQLLIFVRGGKNKIPIAHPNGFTEYFGINEITKDKLKYRGWKGNQIYNTYSQKVWQYYASSHWFDIDIDDVLPYKESRDSEDEKHVHPLQLTVYKRAIVMRSNPGEVVLEPFMGVGSGIYAAVQLGRHGVGIELKNSYFRQAVKNLESIKMKADNFNGDLFAELDEKEFDEIHEQI